MRSLIYTMPLMGSLAGTLAILLTFASSASAPQQAAGFALACALAVVPYVFARAIDLSRDTNASHAERQTAALEKLARNLVKDEGPRIQ